MQLLISQRRSPIRLRLRVHRGCASG
jgi:hypothetical protein